MNLETFPFVELLEQSRRYLAVEIVKYLINDYDLDLIIRKIDDSSNTIIFWMHHYRYNRYNSIIDSELLEDEEYLKIRKLEEDAMEVLGLYAETMEELKDITIRLRIEGLL